MEEGLYLCKVKGLKFCDYAILKWDGEYWWQYYRDLGSKQIEGWIGSDLEIIEVIDHIPAATKKVLPYGKVVRVADIIGHTVKLKIDEMVRDRKELYKVLGEFND